MVVLVIIGSILNWFLFGFWILINAFFRIYFGLSRIGALILDNWISNIECWYSLNSKIEVDGFWISPGACLKFSKDRCFGFFDIG